MTSEPARSTWCVGPAEAGSRLDRYLAYVAPDLTRSAAQRLIQGGAVTVNGSRARPATGLSTGDLVEALVPPELETPTLAATRMPLAIVYADDDVIVVDKPAGMVVHPAAGHRDDTLVNALAEGFPDLVTTFDGQRPGIVHRLDRDTSGVMVVARALAAREDLLAQFKARTVTKTYLAVVRGVPEPDEAVIDAPIGRDPQRRKRMAAVVGGRSARTRYKVLATGDGVSLLEVTPETGRTHQIRVHLALIEHPVLGDRVYGGRGGGAPRLMLHALALTIRKPGSEQTRTFEAPLPADFLEWLAEAGLSA